MPDIDVSAMMKDFGPKRNRTATVAVAKDAQVEKDIATEATEKTGVEVVTGHEVVNNEVSLEEQLAASLAAEMTQTEEVHEENDNASDLESQLAESIVENNTDGWPTAEDTAEASEEVVEASEESEVVEDDDTYEIGSIINYCKDNAMDIIDSCRDEVITLVQERMEPEDNFEYESEYHARLLEIVADVVTEVLNNKLQELMAIGDETKAEVVSTLLSYAE